MHQNIAGDPRYFAPAAWMAVAFGPRYLEMQEPRLLAQYRDHVDHFALGVLTMEVFFALWRGPEAEPWKSLQLASLLRARAAWHAYWGEAVGLFQRIHAVGHQNFREVLTGSNIIAQLTDKLQELCMSLHAVADLQPAGSSAALLFRGAAGLLDRRCAAPRWRELEFGLGGGASAAEGCQAPRFFGEQLQQHWLPGAAGLRFG